MRKKQIKKAIHLLRKAWFKSLYTDMRHLHLYDIIMEHALKHGLCQKPDDTPF